VQDSESAQNAYPYAKLSLTSSFSTIPAVPAMEADSNVSMELSRCKAVSRALR
jgi:hypothetical protein